MRLLAEILTRVPWAINHFHSPIDKTWDQHKHQIIAQVAQRRQEHFTAHPASLPEQATQELPEQDSRNA